jgi:hypothetical protein
MFDNKFETKEEGIEKLKETVSIRNKMGGALYWNIVNGDCMKIADELYNMGVPSEEIREILNG